MRLRAILPAVAGLLMILGLTSGPALAAETATVTGIVTASTGPPSSGATVELLLQEPGDGEAFPVQTTTTGTDGRYSFTGITARKGTYVLLVTPRSGYQRGPGYATANRFTLAAGQEVTQDVRLLSSGVVTGTTQPGSTIHLRGRSVPALATASTGQDGTYRLPQLRPGTYTVTFEDRNGRAECYHEKAWKLPRTEDITDGCKGSTVITVRGGRTTRLETQVLGGGRATFTTRVVDRSGAPIAGVTVVLSARPANGDREPRDIATGTTGRDGRVTFPRTRLTGQTYQLVASGRFVVGSAATRELEVARGEDVRRTLTLTRAGVVEGSVVRGAGVETVFAQMLRPDGRDVGFGEVGSDGRFTIEGVRAGTYVLAYPFDTAPGGSGLECYLDQAPTSDDVTTGCLQATRFTVRAGAVTTLRPQTIDAP